MCTTIFSVNHRTSVLLSRFTNCLAYYALSLSAGSLGGNMYISFALSGLVELPSIFATYVLVDRSVHGSKIPSLSYCLF